MSLGLGASQELQGGIMAKEEAPPSNRPPPFRIVGDRAALFTAFAKARAEFVSLETSRTVDVQMKSGGSYQFDYADLPAIQEATVPALSKNGLSITQPWWQEGNGYVLLTILAHESGASMETETYFENSGDMQSLGSALTYLQRYQWRSICGISASKDDDDGNKAVGNKAVVQPRQSKTQPAMTPDPLMREIAEKARTLDLSKAEGEKLMKAALGVVKPVEFLTKEEAAKLITALTDEQARRGAKEKIK